MQIVWTIPTGLTWLFILGCAVAAWTDLVKHQVVQGASTITEQLVKQQYAGSYVKQKDGSMSYIAPARTITEPKGDCPATMPSWALRMARRIASASVMKSLRTIAWGGLHDNC